MGQVRLSADGAFAFVEGATKQEPGKFGAVTVGLFRCDFATGAHAQVPGEWDHGWRHFELAGDGSRCLLLSHLFNGFSHVQNTARRNGVYDTATGLPVAMVEIEGEPAASAVSADRRAFAAGERNGRVQVLEAATGGVRATFWHKDSIDTMGFSPDGTALAAASSDAPVYLWDVRGQLLDLPKSFPNATGEKLWAVLSGEEALPAFDAMRRLAAAPDDAVKLFARKLSPAAMPAAAWVDERLADLGSRSFAVRDRATLELEAVAELAQPRLHAARKVFEIPEVQRRLARALGVIGSTSPDRLRVLRAVEVLEWVRTPAAAGVLKAWAGGADRAPLTVAAVQAVRRLKK